MNLDPVNHGDLASSGHQSGEQVLSITATSANTSLELQAALQHYRNCGRSRQDLGNQDDPSVYPSASFSDYSTVPPPNFNAVMAGRSNNNFGKLCQKTANSQTLIVVGDYICVRLSNGNVKRASVSWTFATIIRTLINLPGGSLWQYEVCFDSASW